MKLYKIPAQWSNLTGSLGCHIQLARSYHFMCNFLICNNKDVIVHEIIVNSCPMVKFNGQPRMSYPTGKILICSNEEVIVSFRFHGLILRFILPCCLSKSKYVSPVPSIRGDILFLTQLPSMSAIALAEPNMVTAYWFNGRQFVQSYT